MEQALLNRDIILNALTHDAPWCGSHGADGDYLGMGLIYYGLVYVLRARTAVCLGSGGGFVPRVMRQAQRDLGLDQARTILVDANRPQAGWGAPKWLDPNSFFRRSFGEVELALMTTRDAVDRLIAPQNLKIDVLHIDADHSFRACLEDFRLYRPFLHHGSVVTLHDTNFAGAGVGQVVRQLRAHGDCEIVDFPDIGAGTAIVRIIEETASERSQDGDGDAVVLARRSDAPTLAPPEKGWKYLESEAFCSRSALAAHFVRECPTVIEIGGGRTPIDAFLTGRHKSVFVIDPFLREHRADGLNGAPCDVRHIRARFQDIDWQINRRGEYGLVMLGLELQGLSAADRQMLYALVDGARVTVIEFPTSWPPSRDQFRSILGGTRTRERYKCRLDLSGNDVGDMKNSWPPRFDREIHVLEPRR